MEGVFHVEWRGLRCGSCWATSQSSNLPHLTWPRMQARFSQKQLRNTFDQVFSPVEDVSGFSGISCRVRRQEMPLEPDTGHVPDLLSMNRIVWTSSTLWCMSKNLCRRATEVISQAGEMVNSVSTAQGVICLDTHRELLNRGWKPDYTFIERIIYICKLLSPIDSERWFFEECCSVIRKRIKDQNRPHLSSSLISCWIPFDPNLHFDLRCFLYNYFINRVATFKDGNQRTSHIWIIFRATPMTSFETELES